jgi:hypothetical protein
VYVLDGAILASSRYDDGPDELEHDARDRALVAQMVAAFALPGEAPSAYALDVARLQDGSTVLVEVNDAWALGLYRGLAPRDYAAMLWTRWSEIVAVDAQRRDQQDRPPLLHLYAQATNHFPAHVLGSREGLMALRCAIDQALAHGCGLADAFTGDGEGFDVEVTCAPGWAVTDIAQLPYADSRDTMPPPPPKPTGPPELPRAATS